MRVAWRTLSSDEKIAVVNKIKTPKDTAAQTARKLINAGYDGVTRNALLGLSYRRRGHLQFSTVVRVPNSLNFFAKKSPAKRKSKPSTPTATKAKRIRKGEVPKNAKRLNILEIRERGDCKFPLWDDEGMPVKLEDRLYCAAPTTDADGAHGVYCAAHKQLTSGNRRAANG